MASITVHPASKTSDGWSLRVEVAGASRTAHEVTVSKDAYRRFAGGSGPVEELVRASIEFLYPDVQPGVGALTECDARPVRGQSPTGLGYAGVKGPASFDRCR